MVASEERRLPALGRPRPPCARYPSHTGGVGAPVLLRWEHRDRDSHQVGSQHRGVACSPAPLVEDCGGVGSVECNREEGGQGGFSLALPLAWNNLVALCSSVVGSAWQGETWACCSY